MIDTPTLNALCENILDYLECKHLREPQRLLELFKLTPRFEDFWHIEVKSNGAQTLYFLWRKQAWLKSEERIRIARENAVEYNRVLDIRRQAFDNLKRAICQTMDCPLDQVNDPIIVKMAERVMAKRTAASEMLFGVKLSDLPELPRKHTVIDEKGKKQYEL